MRSRNFCFFHVNVSGYRLREQQLAARGQDHLPELPFVEDAASVQVALNQVMQWLLRGVIDHKRAGLLLYSLQTASFNLRQMQKEAEPQPGVAVCDRYDSFEEDFELEDCEHLRVEEPEEEQRASVRPAEHPADAAKAGDGQQSGSSNDDQQQPKESDVARLLRIGQEKGFLNFKGGFQPRAKDEQGNTINKEGPGRITDREKEDPRVRIPLMLTKTQYLQAKESLQEYESEHRIDGANPNGRRPAPQRAAMSQKLFMGSRKPPAAAPFTKEEAVAAATSSMESRHLLTSSHK